MNHSCSHGLQVPQHPGSAAGRTQLQLRRHDFHRNPFASLIGDRWLSADRNKSHVVFSGREGSSVNPRNNLPPPSRRQSNLSGIHSNSIMEGQPAQEDAAPTPTPKPISILKGLKKAVPSPTGDPVKEFIIELDNKEACYSPGDELIGYAVLVPNPGVPLEVVGLRVQFYGSAKLRPKLKGGDVQHPPPETVYMDEGMELVNANRPLYVKDGDPELVMRFEKTLKRDLYTSIVSKSASIIYTVRACCSYRKSGDGGGSNEVRRVHAARGLTILETFNLNHLPPNHFNPSSQHLVKKFGLFSCTGGQIRLNFSIQRSAFVCGENLTIEGKVENKTDRRVDKVYAVLQQVVVIYGASKEGEPIFDVSDVNEDNLALFVDEGSSLKIERNFALPTLPPSTLSLDGSEPKELAAEAAAASQHLAVETAATRRKRFSISTSRLSFSVMKGSGDGLGDRGVGGVGSRGVSSRRRESPNPNPFLKVMYQLCVRVKTGATEVMEVVVPLVIGTVPCEEVQRKAMESEAQLAELMGTATSPTWGGSGDSLMEGDGKSYLGVQEHLAKNVLYLHCRLEHYTPLAQPGETYYCPRGQLNHTNKYPFYVGLHTSSKSSRKVSMMANMISLREESGYPPSKGVSTRQQQSQQRRWQIGREGELREEEIGGESEGAEVESVLDDSGPITKMIDKNSIAYCGDKGAEDAARIGDLTGHLHSLQQAHIDSTASQQVSGAKAHCCHTELDPKQLFVVEVESIGIIRSRALQQHRGSRGPLPAVELPIGGVDSCHVQKQPQPVRRKSSSHTSRSASRCSSQGIRPVSRESTLQSQHASSNNRAQSAGQRRQECGMKDAPR